MGSSILIIDPYLKEPAREALTNLNFLISKIGCELGISLHAELYFPLQGKYNLRDFLNNRTTGLTDLKGVISLGSYVNVTENHPWVRLLATHIREDIIEKGTPFFGICFSHQLFAYAYDATIDFIDGREGLPNGKFDEFREHHKTLHFPPEIKFLNSKLISKSRHEQEVKTIPEELSLILTSNSCKIEGLRHKHFPSFSIQSHPEEFHESEDGWNLLKSVIHFFLLYKK